MWFLFYLLSFQEFQVVHQPATSRQGCFFLLFVAVFCLAFLLALGVLIFDAHGFI
jgi:hypothetical protein